MLEVVEKGLIIELLPVTSPPSALASFAGRQRAEWPTHVYQPHSPSRDPWEVTYNNKLGGKGSGGKNENEKKNGNECGARVGIRSRVCCLF